MESSQQQIFSPSLSRVVDEGVTSATIRRTAYYSIYSNKLSYGCLLGCNELSYGCLLGCVLTIRLKANCKLCFLES
jgi:hypothetical protein